MHQNKKIMNKCLIVTFNQEFKLILIDNKLILNQICQNPMLLLENHNKIINWKLNLNFRKI